MNRRRADVAVSFVVAAVLVLGGALAWQTYQQNRALDQTMGSMMGTSMSAVHGTNPLWYVFGAVLFAGAVGGVYLAFRRELTASGGETEQHRREDDASPDSKDAGTTTTGETDVTTGANERPRPRLLDVLPEDERRVLEPILTSPGITQIELRDRSNFSKSKVSQTVSELEKRGLLYRERQGRTYRIYPDDDLSQNQVQ
ncbi:MarR family transcriptional regulator [Haloferax sp. MBLA0076]|uniref:MarR family transcriptional regulator n=1 Tax=Haloferax litoreum TaxID=2666140 RepID=A0A6A8GEW5_9EURY|nr:MULTISPECIES: MarR family transcriptional regulator [Haloferax]KAB1193159.1 MarR family transcriptional regulator [Haloferax sp. CBA1148]MRX21655.1 MarR family transcriptional regulator [Haloferax litoreum]